MHNIHFGSSADTPPYVLKTAPAAVAILIEQAIATTLTPEIARSAVEGDAGTLATLGRSIAVQEGHLLEAVIVAVASMHPTRRCLTDLRLPVLRCIVLVANMPRNADQGFDRLPPVIVAISEIDGIDFIYLFFVDQYLCVLLCRQKICDLRYELDCI